jgi:hypothetical protein
LIYSKKTYKYQKSSLTIRSILLILKVLLRAKENDGHLLDGFMSEISIEPVNFFSSSRADEFSNRINEAFKARDCSKLGPFAVLT